MKPKSVSDALNETIPYADPDFQHQLEQELIAKMQTTSHEYLNGHQGVYPIPSTVRPTLRLPFTLAAAMLLVILVGSILFVRGKQSPSNLGVMVAGNSTPTISNTEAIFTSTPHESVDATTVPENDTQTAGACELIVSDINGTTLHSQPSRNSPLMVTLPLGTILDVQSVTLDSPDMGSPTWYEVIPNIEGQAMQGWVIAGGASMINDCLRLSPVLVVTSSPSPSDEICRAVVFNDSGVQLRAAPNLSASIIAELESGTEVTIIAGSQSNNWLGEWLFVEAVQTDGTVIEGWIGSDVIAQISSCPLNTINPENLVAPDGKVLSPVVVAVQDIPRGTKITENMLAIVYWPVESVPDNTFSDINMLIDTLATTDIVRYQPYISKGLSFILPPGTVLVAVPISQFNSVADNIKAGDLVDVWVTLRFIDIGDGKIEILLTTTPVPGTIPLTLTPATGQGVHQVTQRIIEAAKVIQVGGYLDGSLDSIVSLAVSPEDAVTIVWLIDAKIPITLKQRE
jgi:Flp pilus assembly protein CpaB